MLWLASLAALLGAGANAVGSVMQKRSAGEPEPGELFGRDFIKATVTHKLWLGGVSFDFLGFLLQALALYYGSLVVVEPLMTVDLIILLVIIYFRYKVPTGSREWGGALAICLGLSALLVTAAPSGANLHGVGLGFAIVAAIVAIVVTLAALEMRRPGGKRWRTAVGALATGVNFSLTAALTKLTMADLSHGVLVMLASWPLYAMLASAATALVMMQTTYASGSLKLSQPIITIVGPSTSVLIGVLIFGTSLRHNPPALAIEAASGLVIALGITMLASSRSVTSFEGNEIL
jgi:drug/metabolite transporter (DMT)-like permease